MKALTIRIYRWHQIYEILFANEDRILLRTVSLILRDTIVTRLVPSMLVNDDNDCESHSDVQLKPCRKT